jgi:thymidylate kinase
MANLIILEGVSRTGKSSITKLLSDKFGFREISIKNKMPDFIDNLPDFYHGMHVITNEFFKAFPNETFILDRSFLSELVYSRSFGRKTYITQDDSIPDMLHDNKFLLVNLTTTHQEYLNRIPKDKKVYSFQEFNTQKDLFYYYFEHYKCSHPSRVWQSNFLEIDTNENTIEQCVSFIETKLEKSKLLKTDKI